MDWHKVHARGAHDERTTAGPVMIEMNIKGLMVDPITNMPIIILRDTDGQKVLPIWVGVFEANAIALQIENIQTPRPMTHDLLRNIIQDLNATVDKMVDLSNEKQDSDRLQQWLEQLDPDDMGKYKM